MKRFFLILLFLCVALTACSIPRIVVLSDPLTAKEHNDLGVSYELMGEKELALKQYELAFKKDRNWDQPLINQGNVHAGMESWNLAEQSYRNALKRNSHNPEAMNNLAYVLIKQDKNREALNWSKKAVEIEPENPFFLNTYGWALLKTDSLDKAKETFLSALENSQEGSDLQEKIRQALVELEPQ